MAPCARDDPAPILRRLPRWRASRGKGLAIRHRAPREHVRQHVHPGALTDCHGKIGAGFYCLQLLGRGFAGPRRQTMKNGRAHLELGLSGCHRHPLRVLPQWEPISQRWHGQSHCLPSAVLSCSGVGSFPTVPLPVVLRLGVPPRVLPIGSRPGRHDRNEVAVGWPPGDAEPDRERTN